MEFDHDINVLNTLITTTIDSANGFERSAEDADSPRFVDMFREYAQERRQVVGRLQERVRMRDAISRGGDKEVIEEVERGEDYLKSKYDAALEDDRLSTETLAVIREAYQSVRSGHDRASALKHGMQDTAV